jgi:hypothetical protein
MKKSLKLVPVVNNSCQKLDSLMLIHVADHSVYYIGFIYSYTVVMITSESRISSGEESDS